MLVFFKENLVFLAVPKTGTTAYQAALRGRADIIYRKRPGLKHTPARKFQRLIAPFFDKVHDLRPETMAVIREPVDQLKSWYRYRQKPALTRLPNSTKDMSFEEFVRAYLSSDPPPPAKIGSQFKFLSNDIGDVLVDHLFAYERPLTIKQFLEDRFDMSLDIPVKNVSPKGIDTSLSRELEGKLKERLAPDISLHTEVLKTGYLRL